MALFMRLLFKSFSDGSTLKNEKRLLFLLSMFVTLTVILKVMSVTKLNFERYQLTFSKEAKNPNISSISACLAPSEYVSRIPIVSAVFTNAATRCEFRAF